MRISFEKFRDTVSQFNKIKNHVTGGEVDISISYEGYKQFATLSYTSLFFASIKDINGFLKNANVPIHNIKINFSKCRFLKGVEADIKQNIHITDITPKTGKETKSLKLVPEEVPSKFRPKVIETEPIEIQEGDNTYRILNTFLDGYRTGGAFIGIAASQEDKIYDYLDKSFFIMEINDSSLSSENTGSSWIISNQYDLNTAHVFMMCKMQPSLRTFLQDEIFINSNDAEMLRIKMERKLSNENKTLYRQYADFIDNDYKKNTTLVVINKILFNEVNRSTINEITFTKNAATYENISIEADELLSLLYSKLDFNGEFDIYTVCELYGNHVESLLTPTASKEETAEDEENPNQEVEDTKSKRTEVCSFKINNIPIVASISETRQRFINNIRINKTEIAKVIHRASCHKDLESYNGFLKTVSRMSIKWHDIIANGLQVKMHSDMTREEYADPNPSPAAPALHFRIDKTENCIKLKISEERGVKIAFGKLVAKVGALNRKVNDRSSYTTGGLYRHWIRKNSSWALGEMVDILIECATFKTKRKQEDGTTVEEKQVGITKEDIVTLLKQADASKKEALKRSKEFLETAMRMTKAEYVDFKGKQAIKVQGNLRTYAVVIANAKVYDYETKQYRCIVNSSHYKGVGYDDIAARLLALKNDSVLQNTISTLQGQAQPQYENAHADYAPLRENMETIEPLINQKLNIA